MTITRRRACEGKRAHRTKEEALDHAFSRRRAGATRDSTQVYRCPFCHYFHVGHKVKRRFQR